MRRMPRLFARFARDEEGAIAIEAVIILPVLFWTYLALFSIFDAYRHYAISQKAAYTIADMISRETNPIDDTYLDGTREALRYLANAVQEDTAVRVTSLRYDADTDEYQSDWSQTRGWITALANSDVQNWHDRVPVMPDGERVIVVETWIKYDPPFNTGLENREIRNFVFTRPRYAPQVLWDDGNDVVEVETGI